MERRTHQIIVIPEKFPHNHPPYPTLGLGGGEDQAIAGSMCTPTPPPPQGPELTRLVHGAAVNGFITTDFTIMVGTRRHNGPLGNHAVVPPSLYGRSVGAPPIGTECSTRSAFPHSFPHAYDSHVFEHTRNAVVSIL